MPRPVNRKILKTFKIENRQQLPLLLPIKHIYRGYPIVDKGELQPGKVQLVSVVIHSSFREVHHEKNTWSVMGKFEKGGLVKILFKRENHKNSIKNYKNKLVHFMASVKSNHNKSDVILTFVEQIMDYEFGRLVPYYSRSINSNQHEIRREIAWVLKSKSYNNLRGKIAEQLNLDIETLQEIINHFGSDGTDILKVIRAAHWPTSENMKQRALAILDGVNAVSVMNHIKLKPRLDKLSALTIKDDEITSSIEGLAFPLRNSQLRAIKTIVNDLKSEYRVNTLLSGDVGSGKTAVFGVLAAAVARSGYKVAVLCPTIILARQIWDQFVNAWPDLSICCIDNNMKGLPESEIYIGTSALFHRLHHLESFGLLIVDEQQKFSRKQREYLANPNTNIIECSATCIPRTYALTSIGMMKVVKLVYEGPKKNIKTRAYPNHDKHKVFQCIDKTVKNGGQVIVIYPRVKLSETTDKSSIEGVMSLWEEHYPGQVRFSHGQMKNEDKNKAVEDVRIGKANILVGTSMLEVGIDLPKVKHVVVVNAEYFGLAQLHQIRGRIARHGGAGLCDFIMSNNISEQGVERMKLLERSEDGFLIASEDMKLRGSGDIRMIGDSQSGEIKGIFYKRAVNADGLEMAGKLLHENYKHENIVKTIG